MVIYIDMDDVLDNLTEIVIDEMNEDFGTNYNWEDTESYWWLDTGRPQSYFEEVLCREGVFKNAPPIKGAIESVNELKKRGFNIVFLTCPHFENKHSTNEKVEWLKQYFDWFDPYQHLVCTNRKDLVGTQDDYLIDDNPKHLNRFRGIKICFARRYNKGYQGVRLGYWEDVLNYIYKLEREY